MCLKSILGVIPQSQNLWVMLELEELGHIDFSLDSKAKQVNYQINDWGY